MDYFANENCSVVFISLESILNSPFRDELLTVLIHTLTMFNIKMERKIDMLAEKSLRDKILMYLNLMSERNRSKEFNTRMTQEQFAQFLCVNRSALSNELSKMKKDGIIDFKKDHFILK
ncbi:MAG: helix-turn-helix domain-containing protein [Mogibacterium sp.]|nr:helix-turn-helix domain-containing protein [Mogibacterium sp.]